MVGKFRLSVQKKLRRRVPFSIFATFVPPQESVLRNEAWIDSKIVKAFFEEESHLNSRAFFLPKKCRLKTAELNNAKEIHRSLEFNEHKSKQLSSIRAFS